ncbi:hypothetical protein Smic_58150 [Streptomyces microflavus]|uniref:Uncharacterized protein n=1 Tax=Streptomyces microflavus TaxID=1919 RepID=A0A7J0CYA5_STRMI|nr:hypothetical protein Smic_58150 [Streptomyces microflavus]
MAGSEPVSTVLPAVTPPAGVMDVGVAVAEPDCSPTAIMAAAAIRAPVAVARRLGVDLTRTPSARGLPAALDEPSGTVQAVRRTG